jgi:acetylornithine deacetylase/succinyl-diaminopimelate desuccinylase-like protein
MPNWSDPDGEMMQILRRTMRDQGRKAPVPFITLGTTDTRLWRFAGVPAYVHGHTPETMATADESIRIDEFLHILHVHTLASARFDAVARLGGSNYARRGRIITQTRVGEAGPTEPR